jgi:hypothetical protein
MSSDIRNRPLGDIIIRNGKTADLGFPTGTSRMALMARAYNQAHKFGAETTAPQPEATLEPLLGCLELSRWSWAGSCRSSPAEPICARQSMRPQQRSPDKVCRQSRYNECSRLPGRRRALFGKTDLSSNKLPLAGFAVPLKKKARAGRQVGEVGGEVSIPTLRLTSSMRNRDITAEVHCCASASW